MIVKYLNTCGKKTKPLTTESISHYEKFLLWQCCKVNNPMSNRSTFFPFFHNVFSSLQPQGCVKISFKMTTFFPARV